MTVLQLELDDDVVSLLRQPDRPEGQTAAEMIILELYRRRSISGGRAAELLGLRRADFIALAGRLGIPYFDLGTVEAGDELDAARRIAGGPRP